MKFDLIRKDINNINKLVFSAAKGVNESSIAFWSKKLKCKFPDELLLLYRLTRTVQLQKTGSFIFGLSAPEEKNDVESTISVFNPFPIGWLPIGDDGFGNSYVLRFSKPNIGIVGFVEWPAGPEVLLCSSSLHQWLLAIIRMEINDERYLADKNKIKMFDPDALHISGVKSIWDD